MKNYDSWYWKLYRWFKWDAKHLHRDIAQGFRNLWKWFPIIWKDRDWDDHYIFEVLKFKVLNTANHIEEHDRFVGCETEVKYMRVCVKLMERIQTEHYRHEYFDYFDFDTEFVPIEGTDLVEYKTTTTRDDFRSYISKYPSSERAVRKNKQYENLLEDTDEHLAMAISIHRHLKARKLLFDILESSIERWWD
jgi:hypothetical protein